MNKDIDTLLHNCFNGKHSLMPVFTCGTDEEAQVVRWCHKCGSFVIDLDYDGRTNAGQIMKMKHPEVLKFL